MPSKKTSSVKVGKEKILAGDQETPIIIKPGPGGGIDNRSDQYRPMALYLTGLVQNEFAEPEYRQVSADSNSVDEDDPYYFVYPLRHPRKRLMAISIYLGKTQLYKYDFKEDDKYQIMLDYRVSAPKEPPQKKPTNR